MQCMSEDCKPQTSSSLLQIFTKMLYIPQIISKATKRCYEEGNKILYRKRFVKKRNIQGITFPNKHNSSLFDGYMDWSVTVDLKYNLIFPAEITLNVQILWSG